MSDKQYKTLKAMKKHMLKKKQIETKPMKHGSEKIVNMMMLLLPLMKPPNWFNISH
jgi:hypothetical protein